MFIYNAVAPHIIGLSVWLDKLAHVYVGNYNSYRRIILKFNSFSELVGSKEGIYFFHLELEIETAD